MSEFELADEQGPTQLQYAAGRPSAISRTKMRLVVVDGPDRGKEIAVANEQVTGGSLAGCDLVLTDKTVSRQHFSIRQDARGFILSDLGSTNGTFVDAYEVSGGMYLRPGTVFHAGKTAIRFQALNEHVEVPLSDSDRFGDALGESVRMREVFGLLERLAPSDISILIEGPTGAGKEVIARSIHKESRRSADPYVVVDCGAVPRNLIESELFGHEKGAFTGATGQRKGAFELARGGTIFLDEIGELPIDLQPKLLRVLENHEVRRLGNSRPVPVDFRLVTATNRNLLEMVANNEFREDLYFRLAVAKVFVPALHERKDDIPGLVEHFLKHFQELEREAGHESGRVPSITEDAMSLLMSSKWPGNVRQLRNTLERAYFLSEDGVIDMHHIMPDNAGSLSTVEPPDMSLPFKDAKQRVVDMFERAYLRQLLVKHKGNIARSAREAEIERKHLRRLLRKHGMHSWAHAQKEVDD